MGSVIHTVHGTEFHVKQEPEDVVRRLQEQTTEVNGVYYWSAGSFVMFEQHPRRHPVYVNPAWVTGVEGDDS